MTRKTLGRYELIRVLGKGAMGLVYEGRDPNLDRRIAIKTIKVENLSEEGAAEYEARFRTEARSAARLQHPNIVSVYDSDRDGDIAYLVMEFIQGQDLKHHLDKGKRHTLEQTLAIMADLLSALDYAHRQKIVHRDIKPANLLIEASGRVKLTDFGVARIQDSGDVTRTQGSMVGTLKYMSPEQVQGQTVDARSDLFAAGVVLYQLLTGRRPFDADSDFAIIQRIVAQEPVAPTSINRQLPPDIDAVVARALEKSRDKRYSSAQEFLDALQACAGQAADPTAVAPPTSAPASRNSTWSGTLRAGESLVDTLGGTGGGGSDVAKELELVYWKDVKDSTDGEDLRGFLARFPTGTYAELARSRLRKLAVAAGDDGAPDYQSGTRMPALSAYSGDVEQTQVQAHASAIENAPRQADSAPAPAPALEDAAPTDSTAPQIAAPVQRAPTPVSAVPEQPFAPGDAVGTDPPADPAPRSTLGKPVAWVLAGVVVLAAAGLVLQLSRGSGTNEVRAVAAPASAPAVSQATTPAPTPKPAQEPVAVPAPVPAVATAPMVGVSAVAPATGGAARAATAASAGVAPVTKKATLDKDKLAKEAPLKSATPVPATTTATVAAPPPSPAVQPAPRARAEPTAAQPTAAVTSPGQACEDRKLIGFQICMSEQCGKPAFFNHPACVERRAMEQQRREVQSNR